MKRITAALGLAVLVAVTVQTGAEAVPRTPRTCLRDAQVVPCVHRSFAPPTNRTQRSWRTPRTFAPPAGR